MISYKFSIADDSGMHDGKVLEVFQSYDGEWHMTIEGTTYRASGFATFDDALMRFHRHRPTLKIQPITPYAEKMSRMLPDDGTHAEAEYRRYYEAMDAICSRNPRRMKPNGMEMLRAKWTRVNDVRLKLDLQRAYDELRMEVGECGC